MILLCTFFSVLIISVLFADIIFFDKSFASGDTLNPYAADNILNQSNILRLSNTEKNLIKRKAYDKKIENNSKSTPLSDYIFSSKKKVNSNK